MKLLRARCIPWYVFILSVSSGIGWAQVPDCSIAWENPVPLSIDSLYVTSPQFAIQQDTVHALWYALDFLGLGLQDGIQYCRSIDGGQTFSPPSTIKPGLIALNPALLSASDSNVYVAFLASIDTFQGTALIRSTDGGITWQSLQRLLNRFSPQILSSSGNHVFLVHTDPITHAYGILRSSDNGATWSPNVSAPPLTSLAISPLKLHGVSDQNPAGGREVYYYSSDDDGAHWSYPDPLSIEDFTPSVQGKIAADETNELYAVWTEASTIFLRRSANQGASWLPQEKISDNSAAQSPDVGASDEFSVISWETPVNGTSVIRLRSSNDFGVTFCPIEMPSSDSGAAGPVVRISHTALHSMWTMRTSDITSKVIYRRGRLTNNPDSRLRPPQHFALKQNYPNPFNGSTHITYNVSSPTHINLTIYNILGQRVATLVDEDAAPGRYEATFIATTIGSGVYFYQLRTDQFIERRKLVILR